MCKQANAYDARFQPQRHSATPRTSALNASLMQHLSVICLRTAQRLLDLQLLFTGTPGGASQFDGSWDQGARASGCSGRPGLVVER